MIIPTLIVITPTVNLSIFATDVQKFSIRLRSALTNTGLNESLSSASQGANHKNATDTILISEHDLTYLCIDFYCYHHNYQSYNYACLAVC